jgi:Tfp pilus assembly protein PilX
MHSVHKILSYRQKAEGGFVLIAALMAVMILMAVGFFILTTTSQDLRMSSRLVGERRAFSAAESGVHQVCQLLNPALPLLNYGLPAINAPQPVDPLYDSSTTYAITTAPVQSTTTPTIPLAGFDMSKAYVGSVYATTVTGSDDSYKSKVSIDIGIVYSPNPSDTQQGQL